jgi:microcystin-dependent protein
MADPFVGEIRIFGFNFAPKGWALANGQILPISQNTALFSLYGTMYGGDGKSTFALPNLQGRAAINAGQGPGLSSYTWGEATGETTVTLLASEMPQHNHTWFAEGEDGNATTPVNGYYAVDPNLLQVYGPATNLEKFSPAIIQSTGGDQPHNNMMPYLVLNFCVALQGVYPQRT